VIVDLLPVINDMHDNDVVNDFGQADADGGLEENFDAVLDWMDDDVDAFPGL
jgi:hypothetical protein